VKEGSLRSLTDTGMWRRDLAVVSPAWAVVMRTDQESEVVRATVCVVSLQLVPVPSVQVNPDAGPFL
jgi:hypothetical protein